MKEEILNVFNVLASPTPVFRNLTERPRWRMPLVLLVLSSWIIGWCMIPAILAPMEKVYTRAFGEHAAAGAGAMMVRNILALEMIVEPLGRLARWLLLASLLYLFASLMTGRKTGLFKPLFAVTAYSEVIFVLMSTVTALIIYAKGIDSIEGSADLTVFKGLNFFFSGASQNNPGLAALLGTINIFSVWYVCTLSIGMAAVTGLSRAKAIGAAGTAWMISTAATIAQPAVIQLIAGFIVPSSL